MSTGPGGFLWVRDDWRERAHCQSADPELFFPASPTATRDQVSDALEWCGSCEVAGSCLEFALSTRADGVWGGTTDAERDIMLRLRRVAEREAAEVAS